MAILNLEGRHQSVRDAARWLEPNPGLDPAHRDVSVLCAELAQRMLARLPDCPELTLALRELTCAKDNFVRASIATDGGTQGWAALRA